MQPFRIYLGLALVCSLTVSVSSLVADTKTPLSFSQEKSHGEQAPAQQQPSKPSPGITVRGAEPSDPSQQQLEETLTVKTAIKTILAVQAPIEVSCQPMAVVAAHTYPTSTTPQSGNGETPAKEVVLNIVDGKVYISCKPRSSEKEGMQQSP
jgi:hypothetical protein